MKSNNKQMVEKQASLSADALLFESLGIDVPSCGKCTKACHSCRFKFMKEVSVCVS